MWLRAHTQGLDWLLKLIAAREEEVEAPEESKGVQALKAELEKAQVVKEKFKSTDIRVRNELYRARNQEGPEGRRWPKQVPRSFMGQQQ